jgi:ureidoacrylate peracid hydrolase
MHRYEIPEALQKRLIQRQGKLISHDTIDAGRTALIVVDMQNYFCAEGAPAEVPLARAIVPNINRMACAMRAAGGAVIWIQTTASGTLERWRNRHTHMLTPEYVKRRVAGLSEDAEGFKLFPTLEPAAGDLFVKKIQYSAFIPGSSDIDAQLRSRGIDTVLVTGTATNVCCESNARDAMMMDYRVIMLSDGNATRSDEEHAATLNTFMMFFGDVMTTDQALERLVPAVQRATA